MNKFQVARKFNRAASSYKQNSIIQYQSARQLFSLCNNLVEPILDLGAGNGNFTDFIATQHEQIILLDISSDLLQAAHQHHQYRVQADYENLPIVSESIGSITANMSLQWASDYEGLFSECWRVLQPGGQLIFSIPIAGTFYELHQVISQLKQNKQEFLNPNEIRKLLSPWFQLTALTTDTWYQAFSHLQPLLHSIKATGVSHLQNPAHNALRGRAYLHQMQESYERYRNQSGRLPLTYHLAFVRGIKR